ncbi:MAG: TonB-dependent receptor [Ignavibacteriales bacterium]|nr:TonB-dependent receptor [Ignavibacteriales bacterium]
MKKELFAIVLFAQLIFAANQGTGSGTLRGVVTDQLNKQLLPGVTIVIKKINTGGVTGENGFFEIKNIPPGTYTISFSCIGYQTATYTDVVIRPDRITSADAGLTAVPVEMADVVVSAGYFNATEQKPISMTNFSAEEVRRSPGTAGDVSRVLFSLPSVAKVNDQRNSLIVRGGSPVENSYYLDNIEIPNINHFPVQGSSDGPIGLINLYYVKDVNFLTGGFSPAFGDRLSSVMEINFREGSREKTEFQTDLSMSGFGASLEGPLGKNASYMVSASKSYLDLIMDAAQTGGALPKYGDMQGKIVVDVDQQNKLTFLNVLSIDDIDLEYKNAVKAESFVYGTSTGSSNVFGVNWQNVRGTGGYSNTALSYSYSGYDRDYSETRTLNHLLSNKSSENEITLRNSNMFTLSKGNMLEAGLENKFIFNTFDMTYEKWQDDFGNPTGALTVDKKFKEMKTALFAVAHFSPLTKLKADFGLRADYFTFNKSFTVAPRATITYMPDAETGISASAGIFYQQIPSLILAQNDAFNNLSVPRADHFILGMSRMLSESTRLSIEGYYKEYSSFPVDPRQPTEFMFDQVMKNGLFLTHAELKDNGKAVSKGIELLIQKKLADEIYGLFSLGYSKAKYRGYNNTWYDRMYDNRVNLTAEGGYLPGSNWEFKLRWSYAGGAPYTPFDMVASENNHKGVLDINGVNSKRLPDYHSLNLRVDKRFNFERSNLLVYLSVWNAYGRKNIAAYEWNEIKNKKDEMLQWSALPVIGVTYEL